MTAVVALVGVALQTVAKHGPAHIVGLVAVAATWLVFVADAVVMLSVATEPGRWARGHAFELVLLVVTCPLWPVLFYRLLLLELLPALTVLEAAKLAKLAKVTYALRRGRRDTASGRVARALIVLVAVALAVFVVVRN